MNKMILSIFFLPITLYSLDVVYIVQPSGWKVSENDKQIEFDFEQSINDLKLTLKILDNGFSFIGEDISYSENETVINLENTRYILSFPQSERIDIKEENDCYSILSSLENAVFIISNDDLKYSIRENKIIFPHVNSNKLAIAPYDLTVERDFGGMPFDNIILKHSNVFIKYFGPIELLNIDKTEYHVGEVLGTYNVSTWISLHQLEDMSSYDFFPVIVKDKKNSRFEK